MRQFLDKTLIYMTLVSGPDLCVGYEFISHLFHDNEEEVMFIAKLLYTGRTKGRTKEFNRFNFKFNYTGRTKEFNRVGQPI